MTRYPRAAFCCVLALLLGSSARLFAEEFDCVRPTHGISADSIIQRLAVGLDYTEDGEIVEAPGKTLRLDAASRVALSHWIVRTRPRMSYSFNQNCTTCYGSGLIAGRMEYDPNIFGDLGRPGKPRPCGACGGRKGPLPMTLNLEIVWSAPLAKLMDSPKRAAFKRALFSAREGKSSDQLVVGLVYMEGKGAPKNLDDARGWLTKAAAQGERAALAPLAALYLDPASTFHDRAYGLALSAVASPDSFHDDGRGFISFKDVENDGASPESGLIRHLQVLEAGLLAPLISQGLQDKSLAEKVMMPDTARRSFAPKRTPAADATPDGRTAFVVGLSRYFGHGFPEPNRDEGLKLLEYSASRREVAALLLLGMHFDAGIVYPPSASTAWAYYAVAARAGATEPFSGRRLRQFAETDIVADWEGAADVLLERFQAGTIPPGMFRQLADLSLYRTLSQGVAGSVAGGPYDTAASQDRPLSKSQAFSRSRSLLMEKLRVMELADEDVTVVRKCWDDGTTRFYSVSGIVTFTNAASSRETAPYTICFKLTDASSPPNFLSLFAGSFHSGEFPAECGRRP